MRIVAWLVLVMGSALPTLATAQEDRFFTTDGLRLRYVDVGRGEPVVLVHGAGGSLATWMNTGVLPALSRTHRVIAYDARGHGKSDRPTTMETQTHAFASADLLRLLDHLHIDKGHIVGYSRGGSVVTRLLLEHPQRFITATLIAADLRFQWTPEQARQYERDLTDRGHERDKACAAGPSSSECAVSTLTLALTYSRPVTIMPSTALVALSVPMLAVIGDEDENVGTFRELKRLKPAMTYVEIAGATHGGETGPLRPGLPSIVKFIAAHSP